MNWFDIGWIDFLQLWTVKFAAIIGALSVIGGLCWRTFKSTRAFWKEWQEDRAEKAKDREKLAVIFSEVKPNGGSSLRDAVNRTERAVSSVQAHLILHLDSNETPTFHLDENGATTWVNRALCDFCDATPGDLLGLNWKNFLHPDDRDRVCREQQSIVAEKRDGILIYRLAHTISSYLEVRVALHRLIDQSGTLIGWSGEVKRI